jgi:hypothetical protein
MRAIRKHILLIKLIYEQARLRLPKISMTFLLKKSKRYHVQPIMNHVRKEQDHASQRIVRSSWVVAVYMNNDHVVTVLQALVCFVLHV